MAWAAAGAGLVATIVWGLWAQSPRLPVEAKPSPDVPVDVPIRDGDVIRFSHGFAERIRLTTALATSRSISPLVRAIGTASFDLRHYAAVAAPLPARIRAAFKQSGDEVAAGDVLAELESVEIGRAQADFVTARAREKAAFAWLNRERRAEDDRAGVNRSDEARATYEASRTERMAAERTVKAFGAEPQGAPGVLVFRSPIAGRVVQAKVARGQPVKTSDTLFEVADLGTIWAELDVFERDLANVRVGDPVTIAAQTAKGQRIEGKVVHIGDVIDRDSRTASVRVTVDNRAGELRPGQSLTAQIAGSRPALRSVTVPLQAVTKVDGQSAVFVVVDEGTVRLREITTGVEDLTNVAVVEGLKAGERVVATGAFAIKAEIYR
ncbi:MAG TPA: efflux RND transporter periplasmic adaptor subunit [Polyangia bacterium]